MLITNNTTNQIADCFAIYDYTSNGYIRNPGTDVSYNPGMWNCFAEVLELPHGIVHSRFCYTPEGGFFEYLTREQRIKNEAIAEVQEGAKNG